MHTDRSSYQTQTLACNNKKNRIAEQCDGIPADGRNVSTGKESAVPFVKQYI